MTEVYPSDGNLLNLVAENETGVEYIETGKAPYYLEFRKMLHRLLLATRRANDLRVYDEGGLAIGVKAGKFWDGETLRTFAGGSGQLLADNRAAIYLYLNAAGTLVTNEYQNWPGVNVNHIRLAVVSTAGGDIVSLVDARDQHFFQSLAPALADGVIKERMLGKTVNNGISSGAVACRRIGGAELKALLVGTTQNLFAVQAGEVILQVVFATKTPAGAACLVDIGLDGSAGGVMDADGLLVDANANAVGVYSSAGGAGVYSLEGGRPVAAEGHVTITASSNQAGSGFEGGVYILYLAA